MIQRLAVIVGAATTMTACAGLSAGRLGMPSTSDARLSAPQATPTPYAFKFRNFDDPKYPNATIPAGIDTSDEVLGNVTVTQNHSVAFTSGSSHLHFHWLRYPKASSTVANAISPNGRTIVGYFENAQHRAGAFIFEDGNWARYKRPTVTTQLLSVNDKGDVAGLYSNRGGRSRAFAIIRGRFVKLEPPGSVSAAAIAIGASENVAGNATLANGSSEGWLFIARSNSFVSFVYPNAAITQVAGITDDNVIVGSYSNSSGVRGFILRNPGTAREEWQSVDDPKANDGTGITGVNRHHDIVGAYFDASNHEHGFIAKARGF